MSNLTEAQRDEANALIRHMSEATWDASVWVPGQHHVFGTIDVADRVRLTAEVIEVRRITSEVTSKSENELGAKEDDEAQSSAERTETEELIAKAMKWALAIDDLGLRQTLRELAIALGLSYKDKYRKLRRGIGTEKTSQPEDWLKIGLGADMEVLWLEWTGEYTAEEALAVALEHCRYSGEVEDEGEQ